METETRPAPPRKTARPLTFFRGFLKRPKEVGSVIPSSRALIRRILRHGDAASARTIVELGPGTGVITKEILKVMRPTARLLAMEINPLYIRALSRDIRDDRLELVQRPAIQIPIALERIGADGADLVISGIPFSTIPRNEACATLRRIRDSLAPNGRFVAYQFRSEVRRLAEPIFGRPEVHQGFWNIPPMRIYVWRKP